MKKKMYVKEQGYHRVKRARAERLMLKRVQRSFQRESKWNQRPKKKHNHQRALAFR